jgi:hypothetical protein
LMKEMPLSQSARRGHGRGRRGADVSLIYQRWSVAPGAWHGGEMVVTMRHAPVLPSAQPSTSAS